jgi:hypothetical protein
MILVAVYNHHSNTLAEFLNFANPRAYFEWRDQAVTDGVYFERIGKDRK